MMINLRNGLAALALGLAVAAAASPAMAAQKLRAHPGHAANAQATESNAQATEGDVGEATMTKDRDAAIRECSGKANALSQTTWGYMQGSMYRSCMAGHGQPE